MNYTARKRFFLLYLFIFILLICYGGISGNYIILFSSVAAFLFIIIIPSYIKKEFPYLFPNDKSTIKRSNEPRLYWFILILIFTAFILSFTTFLLNFFTLVFRV